MSVFFMDPTMASRLKLLRMQKGMSQKEFAKSVNIAYPQYNRYERGDNIPTAEILTRLADCLDTSIDFLLEGKEKDAAVADFADRELLNLFKDISFFSNEEKAHVKFVLEGLVKNKKYEELSSR